MMQCRLVDEVHPVDGVGLVDQFGVVVAATFRESGYSTPSTGSTLSTLSTTVHPPPPLPQHQFRDLQGVKGSAFQELVAAAPER